MVLSEYWFISSRAALTCSRLVPSPLVLAKIVWIDSMLVSYSWKPSVIGCRESDLTIWPPAASAFVVMPDSAVAATVAIARKPALTLSICVWMGPRLTLPASAPRVAIPFLAPSKFSAALSLSKEDIVSETFFWKDELSNVIFTTLLSTDPLIW